MPSSQIAISPAGSPAPLQPMTTIMPLDRLKLKHNPRYNEAQQRALYKQLKDLSVKKVLNKKQLSVKNDLFARLQNVENAPQTRPTSPLPGGGESSGEDVEMPPAAPAKPEPPKETPEEKRAKEDALLAETLKPFLKDPIKEETVVVTIHQNPPPRYVPTEIMTGHINNDRASALKLAAYLKNGAGFVIVHVYKHAAVSQKLADLCERGLIDLAERDRLPKIKNLIDPESEDTGVDCWHPNPAWNFFLIVTETTNLANRICDLNAITVRMEKEGATFLFSKPGTWGSRVILDVHNARNDKEATAALVGAALRPIIAFKEEEPTKPSNFKIAELAPRESQKGSKGKTWRVQFEPKLARWKGWAHPKIIGFDSRNGDITLNAPPFCHHCMSWSHTGSECAWWRENGIIGGKKRPATFIETTWEGVSKLPAPKRRKDKKSV